MSVNYNDGKWHGWNGGHCPVHPETVVQVVWGYDVEPTEETEVRGITRKAGGFQGVCWGHVKGGASCNIIAFRVIKEHKEPREFYAREMVTLSIPGGKSDTYWQECSPTATGATLFREVTP